MCTLHYVHTVCARTGIHRTGRPILRSQNERCLLLQRRGRNADALLKLMLSGCPSFDVDGGTFVKGNVAVHPTGVVLRDHPVAFTVVPEELSRGSTIGRGSSSTVVAATHVPSKTRLALKMLNVYDKSRRDQLVSEIRTLYNDSCEHVVTFYGAFHRDGVVTIALEYMDGGSLANTLNQVGALPEPVLAATAYQILCGLAHLRNCKRVHRDVKPSNVLINSAGRVKLSDFGISKELQSSIAMCSTFVGSYKYMSPERMKSAPYSYSADIWSFGVLVIECATGTYPYPTCRTPLEAIDSVIEVDIVALSRDQLSEPCSDFVSQCCSREPSKRLPAEILLGSPWFSLHCVISAVAAIDVVKDWIETLRPRQASSPPKPPVSAAAATSQQQQGMAAASAAPASASAPEPQPEPVHAPKSDAVRPQQ